MGLKIIVADDHVMFREGLSALLRGIPGTEIVAEANNGRETLRLCRELSPDLVIMDVSMPDLNGIEATRQIKAECPGVKVVAVSQHSSRRMVMAMLKAGALGYLLKECAFQELADAVAAVSANKAYLTPSISSVVLENIISPAGEASSPTPGLTPREQEVLQLLAEGKRARHVASELNISLKTVHTHRRNIMQKLDVHSVAELTRFAIREGLTSP